MERCMECHDSGEASGGLDLQSLATDYSPDIDMKLWEKIESEVVSARMPPESAEPLSASEREQIASWFKDEFVLPGGIQHAGYVLPRRLTREELQNTLEDILFIPIRSEVTNSRLHVIPDTLVEKFFTRLASLGLLVFPTMRGRLAMNRWICRSMRVVIHYCCRDWIPMRRRESICLERRNYR